jgi:hypothetical protein
MNKQKNKHSFLLLGEQKLIYIICCFLLWNCGNNRDSTLWVLDAENKTTDNKIDMNQETNMPEFFFENLTHNFGKIIQGERINYIFHFKNIGKSTLIISDIETSCGCTTTIPLKKPIEPGENGEIAISFDTTHKSGEVIIYVTVIANTNPAQTILTINAHVINP